jgi:Predicted solute binding protein
MISNSTFVDVSFNLFMETYQAIKIHSSRNLLITYNSIYCNNCFSGLYLYAIRYSTIAHNVVKGKFGIFLLLSDNNSIYNNLFENQELNYYVYAGINNWNTQPIQGVNILGGNFIGGNAYLLSNNNGYSQTCSDENRDGFCDQPLVLNNWNVDYYPLKYYSFMNPNNTTFYIYTTTVFKTITTTHTTTQTITKPVTLTTTTVTRTLLETITTTRIETIMHSTVVTTTVPTTVITTQINPVTKTSTQVLTEISTTTHVYTTTHIEQIVSSIVSTLIALILAVAAIAVLSILTPRK